MKTFSYYAVALATLLLLAFGFAHSFTANGIISDENGQPVAGASITIKGTKKGTVSDADGKFAIEVPGKGSKLSIAAVGYNSVEVVVKDEKLIMITLQTSSQNLSEVVVTSGLGVMRNKAPMGNSGTYIAGKQMGISYDEKEEDKAMPYNGDMNREGYDHITENNFLEVGQNPLSTFSIDVDGASYSNIRRMLNYNQLPPAGAVRIEEMINYFTYQYPQPQGDDPVSINTEIAECPWNGEHRIVSIGLQGKKLSTLNLPPSNLTFLIDVSGSMDSEDKLPLVKSSLKLLTNNLREQDRVSIVVYAGNAGLVLPPTPGVNKNTIITAIQRLEAGGSTAGGEGIQLAYNTARKNFIAKGNNRVILCTDGDFNVGQSSDDALERLIEKERESGIYLTVLGFGTGNYQDGKMQKLADKGNGNHSYIDNINEAKKVFVNEFGGTLFTIAKDVKLQVEFNPAKVQGYRLIGYENRMLAKEDFNNDRKDAGEMGSGHTVTALYEIIPAGTKATQLESVDGLRYQQINIAVTAAKFNGELLNIKLRYKQPGGDVSELLEHPVMDKNISVQETSENLRFACAVAEFGMLLRNSENKGSSSYMSVLQLAANALANDTEGYRNEFLSLVKRAKKLSKDVAMTEEVGE